MKLQIDTTAKTIKIEESVNLGELIEKLKKILPNKQWKEYTIETTHIHNWTAPIVIENTIPFPFTYPNKPYWEQPYTICSTNYTTTVNLEI